MCGTVTAMQNRPEDIRRKGREHLVACWADWLHSELWMGAWCTPSCILGALISMLWSLLWTIFALLTHNCHSFSSSLSAGDFVPLWENGSHQSLPHSSDRPTCISRLSSAFLLGQWRNSLCSFWKPVPGIPLDLLLSTFLCLIHLSLALTAQRDHPLHDGSILFFLHSTSTSSSLFNPPPLTSVLITPALVKVPSSLHVTLGRGWGGVHFSALIFLQPLCYLTERFSFSYIYSFTGSSPPLYLLWLVSPLLPTF